ncbi:ABC transporter permease [Actinomyces minihominis]|uniref:ABC transporter permease n=1 Tax=Actinomyces minihominis TaxID=2002838 RepID=UPI0013EB2C36|nr:ABC transporter permease [Actinomyces minihominis]
MSSSEQQREIPLDEWLGATYLATATAGELPVRTAGLSRVGQRPGFFQYWAEVWNRRAFILADARAKAFQTTRGMLLGKIWLVVAPFLNAAIFWVIFGLLLKTSRGIDNFIGYLVIGVSFFGYMQGALTKGSQVMVSSQNLIRSFMFPRATVMISWTIRSLLDLLPVVAATMAFVVVFTPAVPTWRWVLIIPILLIATVFVNGLAMFTASLTTSVPDLKFIWPLLGRFWFYVSGVFFSLDRFEADFWVSFIMQANPGYVFLTMSRDVLIYGTTPSLFHWVYFTVWAVGMWLFGAILFWLKEESYGA